MHDSSTWLLTSTVEVQQRLSGQQTTHVAAHARPARTLGALR